MREQFVCISDAGNFIYHTPKYLGATRKQLFITKLKNAHHVIYSSDDK